MKEGKLLRSLRSIAKSKGMKLELVRHGGSHDLYRIGTVPLVVPRHREINEHTVKSIIRAAEGA